MKSMTAFARAEQTKDGLTVQVTMRSYNSRFLDIVLHMPDSCLEFEDQIRQAISGMHQRGRIDTRIHVKMEDSFEDGASQSYDVDINQAKAYYQALCTLNDSLGLNTAPTLAQVLAGKNFIVAAPKVLDENLLKTAVLEVLQEASQELDEMRAREGEHLLADLLERVQNMEDRLKDIKDLAGTIPELYRKKLEERLTRLLDEDALPIDPVRLAQEVAILSDKSDVTEEIIRLYSHIAQFREIMEAPDSQGPKLNFLVQEFLREFNTIGSKASHADMTRMVVEFKSELEKIREQVQNIE